MPAVTVEGSRGDHVTGSVVIADDDPVNRLLVREVLEADGHTVYEARDGYEALRAATHRPDVILLDIMMPNMDGFEVCRQLKADPDLASIPVLLVTSLADRRDRLAGIAAGANDFLTKPLDTYEVVLRVRNAVHLHSLFTQLQGMHEQMNHLFGMASHDMLNPLAMIRTYSTQLLSDREKLPEPFIRCLTTIDRSASYLLRLVSDLLDVSKIEAGKLTLHLERCDILQMVGDVVLLNQILADRKSIRIDLQAAIHPEPIYVDRAKIEQVLNNLISNAIRFSPPASTVTVSLEPGDGTLDITVADEGPGIPANELGLIFKPFGITSLKSAEGELQTGLGLAIADKVVRGHGGCIRVDSTVGKGSRFHVSLPVSKVDPATLPDATPLKGSAMTEPTGSV